MSKSSEPVVKGIILDQPGRMQAADGLPRIKLVPPPHRDWSVGICGCCAESDWCCYAFCCYFCVLKQLTKALRENVCLPCLPWCGLLALRMKIRMIYGVQGTACKDCCQLCFCNGCVACQMHREAVELGLIDRKGCADTCRNCCVVYI